MATIISIAPNTHVTVLRENFPLAVKAATIISYKLNDEVNIANKNNNRNKLKYTKPKGSWENAAGRTINNNPGPSAGSNPKANTTGKIANPANSETNIFIPTTAPADEVKLTSRCK